MDTSHPRRPRRAASPPGRPGDRRGRDRTRVRRPPGARTHPAGAAGARRVGRGATRAVAQHVAFDDDAAPLRLPLPRRARRRLAAVLDAEQRHRLARPRRLRPAPSPSSSGRLVEHELAIGARAWRTEVAAGQVFSFGPDHIHRLTGRDAGSVSVHAYSPPLWRMGQYAVARPVCCAGCRCPTPTSCGRSTPHRLGPRDRTTPRTSFDLVVIGGGVMGLFTAYHASARFDRVAVLDAARSATR